MMRTAILILASVLILPGCAGRAWRQAQEEDTVAAYHRFLRDNGGSAYADRARAHLEFARVRKKPTAKGFESFQKKYPNDPLVEKLRPHVEEPFFRAARAHCRHRKRRIRAPVAAWSPPPSTCRR